MGRKILAVVVAIIAAIAIMMIVETANSMVMARPSEAVMKDPAAMREYMANGPLAAYLVVLVGYFLASFAGGFIVAKLSRESPGIILAVIVGAFLTLGMVATILMLPGQPLWFIVVAFIIFIPVTLIGHRFAR